MRRGLFILVLGAATVVPVAMAGGPASPGDLSFERCITGNSGAGPEAFGGNGACEGIPLVTANGSGSGMSEPAAGAVSPDGRNLYLAVTGADGVARYERNPRTGAIIYGGCLTGNTSIDSCTQTSDATNSGDESGTGDPEDIEVSQDGRNVYLVAQRDSAVATFKRNKNNGGLTYKGCLTGDTQVAIGNCQGVPGAAVGGAGSGLGGAHEIVLAPNDKDIYVVSNDDDSVARFSRDKDTGELTYKGCLSGDFELGPDGSGACSLIPAARSGGAGSGMDSLEGITISGNGKTVYAIAQNDDAVAAFNVANSGALSFQQCITADSDVPSLGDCTPIPEATASAQDSGMAAPEGVVATADGKSVYVSAKLDDSVVQFDRARSTGRLKFKRCITGVIQVVACEPLPEAGDRFTSTSGMGSPEIVAVTPDGRSVYVPSESNAVAHFKRDTQTGKLSFKGCLAGSEAVGPAGSGACDLIPTATGTGALSGLAEPESLAISPDSKSVYAIAQQDDAVAHLKRKK